ncbi:hypothetical protein SCE1572_36450 [Sorangium cellulosum So0157-2]|uniref:Uncharacterized protein n=1 Tax=Sorangium cellulosum So0157-2 TaxID=1254432 RepID=S4Y9N5_SORCE|nr:hypothetical protein SCE1572_36450 [Sorangium cellulosum So0157-2]
MHDSIRQAFGVSSQKTHGGLVNDALAEGLVLLARATVRGSGAQADAQEVGDTEGDAFALQRSIEIFHEIRRSARAPYHLDQKDQPVWEGHA